MRLDDTAKLSTRMFKTNPARTWLTILGMGVGTSAVVMLVGLGFGLQGILLEQIILGDTLLSLNVTNPGSHAVTLTQEQLDKFMQVPNVVDVSPMASFSSLITFNGLTGTVSLQGVKPTYFRYAGIVIDKGELFKDTEEEADRGRILLTKAALKLFQISDPKDAIGQKVKIRVLIKKEGSDETQEMPLTKEYTIKGVTNDNATIASMITLPELLSQIGVPFYDRAQVKVAASGFLTAAQDEIVKRGFVVTTLSKTVDQANQIFQGVQAVLAVFGGIALVVSAIGMFNTMTVTLLERTNEIGIMRTIGASSTDIKILFLSESVVVGFLGGIVGMGIGVGGGLIINLLLNLVARNFGGVAVALFSFPPLFLLFIAGFSAIVGFLTGVFPARRASALSPLDAIRYK